MKNTTLAFALAPPFDRYAFGELLDRFVLDRRWQNHVLGVLAARHTVECDQRTRSARNPEALA